MALYRSAAGYTPLLVNLEGHWDKKLADLPDELRALVEAAYWSDGPFSWDGANGDSRKRIAAQLDHGDDPAHEPGLYFAIEGLAGELTTEIGARREKQEYQASDALRDVVDRLERLLEEDRARLGAEVRRLQESARREAELAAEVERLRGELDAERSTRRGWPWGEHNTELLGFLADAAKKFWTNYDPTDRTTAPTNEVVKKWLTDEKGVADRTAEIMASILRPDDLPTGPRK